MQTLKIDQFYISPTDSIVKFKGYKEGKLLFHKYFKVFTGGPYGGWNFSAVEKDRASIPTLKPSYPPE